MPLPPDRLQDAYARYDEAQGSRDREQLTSARLNLCLELLATGWQAPEAVREQMQRDEKTLRRLRETATDELLGLPEQRWTPAATSST